MVTGRGLLGVGLGVYGGDSRSTGCGEEYGGDSASTQGEEGWRRSDLSVELGEGGEVIDGGHDGGMGKGHLASYLSHFREWRLTCFRRYLTHKKLSQSMESRTSISPVYTTPLIWIRIHLAGSGSGNWQVWTLISWN